MLQYLIDFIFFSITGFIGEIIHAFVNKSKSGKALRGPWCPLYGIGGIIIISIINLTNKNPLVIFILGCILASIIEYLASVFLEKIFKTKWWDYSERKFNLNGRICLKNSLLFGILTLILYYYIYYQKLSTRLLKNKIYIAIILIIIILIIIDGIITIVEALELKRRLEIIDNKSDNKNTLKENIKKLKTNLNPNRLLNKFSTEKDEKITIVKKYYKTKTKK